MSRLPRPSFRSCRRAPLTPPGLLLVLVFLAGCTGGEGLILPGAGQPATIAVVEGNSQSARVGETLADPVVFEVTDSKGRPVEDVPVAFEFTSGGPGADVVPDNTTTNSAGLADARVVLGTTVGVQTGRARVVTGEGRPAVETSFNATALSEDANSMAAVAGEDQTGHAGLPLDDLLVVEVTDGFGNPVAGVPIDWTVEGGGSVSAAVVETGQDGRARVERTLGPAVGRQTTLATSEGLAGSPVTFVHTALAGDASRLIIVSGDDQTGAAGSVLPTELVVRLVDADGNGVPGTAVSWVVATGGGSASPEFSTTDADGRASAQWTLGDALGEQRLDAVVSGLGFASFSATATAGAPASLFISTQPSSSARNGVRFDRQPVIQVRDARGNDVALAGVLVSVRIESGGGELRGTRLRNTDAAGRATFIDLAIAGAPGKRTLVFTAPDYAGATSSEIDITATPTLTTITGDSPDPSVAGTTFPVSVRVTSAGPTPTGTVTVTVSGGAPSCTTTLAGGSGSCSLTLDVSGDRTLTATYSGGPGLLGSSDTEPHTVTAAPPSNEAPDADFNWHCEGRTCQFTDRSSDSDGTIATRSWNFGDGTPTSGELNPSHTYAVAGRHTVRLTVTDNGGLSDDATDVVDPEAESLRLRREPSSSAVIGVPFDRQPEVELRAGGDDLERAGVVISVSVASGAGSLSGATTVTTNGEGRAEFSNLSIGGATGPHRLRFSASGFGEVISNEIEVRKHSSDTEITSHEPDPSLVGQVVRVAYSVTGSGGTPTGTVTVTVEGGSETCSGPVSQGFCDLTLTSAGVREITATYGGDGRFEGSSDEVEHDVDEPNQAPTAAFTSSCTDLTCSFNSGGSNDPDGNIQSRNWNFGDGDTGSGATPSHTYASAGTYTVTLTVTDDDGASDDVSHQVTVTAPPPPNQPPTAAFTSSCSDLTCSFNSGGTSDSDGSIQSRSWDFGDGESGSGATPSHGYASAGTYTVTLTVTDDDGASDDVSQQVTVTAPPPPNQPPTAAFTPPSCTTGQPCQFDDESTDSDGTIVSWSWNFGEGDPGSGTSPSHTYGSAGTYTVTLTVTDDDGDVGTASNSVTVSDPPVGP